MGDRVLRVPVILDQAEAERQFEQFQKSAGDLKIHVDTRELARAFKEVKSLLDGTQKQLGGIDFSKVFGTGFKNNDGVRKIRDMQTNLEALANTMNNITVFQKKDGQLTNAWLKVDSANGEFQQIRDDVGGIVSYLEALEKVRIDMNAFNNLKQVLIDIRDAVNSITWANLEPSEAINASLQTTQESLKSFGKQEKMLKDAEEYFNKNLATSHAKRAFNNTKDVPNALLKNMEMYTRLGGDLGSIMLKKPIMTDAAGNKLSKAIVNFQQLYDILVKLKAESYDGKISLDQIGSNITSNKTIKSQGQQTAIEKIRELRNEESRLQKDLERAKVKESKEADSGTLNAGQIEDFVNKMSEAMGKLSEAQQMVTQLQEKLSEAIHVDKPLDIPVQPETEGFIGKVQEAIAGQTVKVGIELDTNSIDTGKVAEQATESVNKYVAPVISDDLQTKILPYSFGFNDIFDQFYNMDDKDFKVDSEVLVKEAKEKYAILYQRMLDIYKSFNSTSGDLLSQFPDLSGVIDINKLETTRAQGVTSVIEGLRQQDQIFSPEDLERAQAFNVTLEQCISILKKYQEESQKAKGGPDLTKTQDAQMYLQRALMLSGSKSALTESMKQAGMNTSYSDMQKFINSHWYPRDNDIKTLNVLKSGVLNETVKEAESQASTSGAKIQIGFEPKSEDASAFRGKVQGLIDEQPKIQVGIEPKAEDMQNVTQQLEEATKIDTETMEKINKVADRLNEVDKKNLIKEDEADKKRVYDSYKKDYAPSLESKVLMGGTNQNQVAILDNVAQKYNEIKNNIDNATQADKDFKASVDEANNKIMKKVSDSALKDYNAVLSDKHPEIDGYDDLVNKLKTQVDAINSKKFDLVDPNDQQELVDLLNTIKQVKSQLADTKTAYAEAQKAKAEQTKKDVAQSKQDVAEAKKRAEAQAKEQQRIAKENQKKLEAKQKENQKEADKANAKQKKEAERSAKEQEKIANRGSLESGLKDKQIKNLGKLEKFTTDANGSATLRFIGEVDGRLTETTVKVRDFQSALEALKKEESTPGSFAEYANSMTGTKSKDLSGEKKALQTATSIRAKEIAGDVLSQNQVNILNQLRQKYEEIKAKAGEAKQAESEFAAAFEQMNVTAANNAFNKQVDAYNKLAGQSEGMLPGYKERLEEIRSSIEQINSMEINPDESGEIQDISELRSQLQAFSKDVKSGMYTPASESGIESARERLATIMATNTKASSGRFKPQFENLQGIAGSLNVGTTSQLDLEKFNAQISNLKANIDSANKAGASFGSMWKQRMGSLAAYLTTFASFYRIIGIIKDTANTVRELDTAMVELQKVSDASATRLQQSFENSKNTAKELGVTIQETINATADWSRLGYSVDQAEELAKVAVIYKHVGDGIDIDTANESLISTLQGFKMNATEAMDIIDKFNETANNMPIDSAGIGEALQRSAASFHAANTDLSESIALITGANAVVQDPSRVGNMWKTVSMRIRGAKADLEEMGEDTSDMAHSTSDLRDLVKAITGFDIMENETQFKSIYDIVVGIGKEWDKISDVDRSALLQKLAGKAQGNALAAALESPELIEQAYQIAEGSEGSAMREQEIWEESIDARIQKMKASLEVLASDVLDSDMFKALIDGATKLIDLVDTLINEFGSLSTILGGLSAFSFVKAIPGFAEKGRAILQTESLTDVLKGDIGKGFKDKGDIAKYAAENGMGAANIQNAIDQAQWSAVAAETGAIEANLTGASAAGGELSEEAGAISAELGGTAAETGEIVYETAAWTGEVGAVDGEMATVVAETGEATVEAGVFTTEMGVAATEAGAVEAGMAGVAAETTGAAGAATGLSATLTGIGTTLATFAPLLLGIGALIAATMAAKYYEEDYKRKAEDFQDKQSEYEENLHQIEDYKTQIEDLDSQIEDINSKEKLTFTDKAELANLQAQKDELIQLKEIHESLLADQKRESSDAAMEALSSDKATFDLSTKHQTITATNGFREVYDKTDLLTAQKNEIKELEKGEQELAEYEKELAGARTEAEKKSVQKRIDLRKKENSELKNKLETQANTLKEYQNALDTTDEAAAKKYSEIGAVLRDTNNAMSDSKAPVDQMRKNIESAFTSTDESISKSRGELKDYLIDAVNDGKTATEALAGIGLTVEDLDLGDITDGSGHVVSAVASLNQYFNDLKTSADSAKKSEEEALALSQQVDGTFEGVEKAQESQNAGANWESMAEWVKGGKELLKKGLVGTDDFQTIAQFMSPTKIDTSKFKFASDAYVDAWQKAYKKVNRYFDTDNPFDSMDRFRKDAIKSGVFKEVNSETGEVENNFKTTAEAAEKMGLSVEATETILKRLRDYGFEFAKVDWSGEQLNEYRDNLEQLQQLYTEMEPDAEKDRLGFLLEGFDSQYKIYQEDMDKLDEEAIIHLKFEYDLSEVLSAIQDLQSNILNDPEGFKKYSADYIMNLERAIDLMEEQTGITKDSKNAKDYAKSYKEIEEINDKLQNQDLPEKQREDLLRQKSAIEEVQKEYQQALLNGQEIDWSSFLTDNLDDILKDLPGLTEDVIEEVQNIINGTKGKSGGKNPPKSDYTRNPLVGKNAEEQRRYYNKHKDEMTDEQKEMYQKSWLEGQGKNAGINKNGNLVDDVDASNKRIEANKKLDKSNQKLVDSYLKLNETKRKGSKQEKALIDAAKKQNTTQDALIDKYGKTTEAVEKYNNKKAEQRKLDQITNADKTGPKPTQTTTQDKPKKQKKETASPTVTPTVDVSKAKEQMSELTTDKEAQDIVVNLIGNDEATPVVEAWNELDPPDKEVEFTAQDKATAVLTIWNTLSADPKFTELSAEDRATWVINTWNALTPAEKMAILKGNNTDAVQKINTVKGMTIPSKSFSIIASGADYVKGVIQSIKDKLSGLHDKTINIKTKHTNISGQQEGAHRLYGTAHASGTPSWISGLPDSALKHTPIDTENYPSRWQTKKSDNPLVGEVGPEMVVNGNRWWLVGENGPEFTHIPAHSVVFNSRQTKELLEDGQTTRRGTAHLNGSFDHDWLSDDEALLGGTAYVDKANGGKLKKYTESGKTTASKPKDTSKKPTPKKNPSTKNPKDKKKKKKKTSAWDKFEKWLSKLFDWIEIKLDRLADKTDMWTTAAEKAVEAGSNSQKTFYQNAISSTEKEISANTTAQSKYKAEAKTVGKKGAKAAGIKNPAQWTNKIINKLANGTLDITKYSEKKQSVIKDIQEWYDKSREAAKAVRDLTDNLQDLYGSLRDIPNVKADASVEKLANSLEHLKNQTELGLQYTDKDYKTANSRIDQQTANMLSQRNERLNAYNTTKAQLSKDRAALNKWKSNATIKAGLNSGKKIEINDSWAIDAKKAVAAYNASIDANITANQNYIDAQDAYLSAFYENAAAKLDNITSWYETISDKFTSKASELSTYVDLTRLEGAVYNSNSSVFDTNRTALTNDVNNAKTEYENYLNEVNRQITNRELPVGGKEYNEAMSQLNNLRESYYSAAKDLREFNDSLVELDFENLENQLDRIQMVLDRLSDRDDLAEKLAGRKGAMFNPSEELYAEEIDSDVEKISVAYQKYADALEEQKKYTIGSDKWNEFAEKVSDARSEIKGLYEDIIDVSDTIRELRWKPFEDGLHKLERVNTELEQIQSLLKEDSFLNDNGTFSSEGLANIALFGQRIDNNNGLIDVHRKAIEKLNDEYEEGMISLDDLTDKTEEHMDAIHDLATETEDYRQNILDQYLNSIERQNDLLNESIDLREKNLDRMKSYYDYQKTIQTKTKDIVYLENQIRALQGTSNENSRARLASLQNQLQEARTDLADTTYEHEMQLRSDGYNKLREDGAKALEDLTNEVKRNTDLQSQIINEMLNSANMNYTNVYNVISEKIKESGLVISESTSTTITELNQTATELGNLGVAYGDVKSTVEQFADANNTANASIIETGNAAQKSVKDLQDLQNAYNATKTVLSTDTSNMSGTSSTTPELGGQVASAPAPAPAPTPAPKPTPAPVAPAKPVAPKQTVTATQAGNALSYIMSKVQYASKQNDKWGVFNKTLYNHNKNRKIMLHGTYAKEAWKKLGSPGTFSSQNLLNACKSTGIWDVLIQIRTDKNKKITFPTWGAVHGYASGSKSIPSNQIALTQEKGQELVYRRKDGAVLTPLGKGDKVFTNEMTENLWKMSKLFSEDALRRNISDVSKTSTINDNRSVNINFDNFINVEGNADQNTLKDMEKVANKQIDLFEKRIMDGMKLNGYKMRF